MTRIFVDTNVFLRFLTLDDAGQGELAERLFRSAAAGEVALVTGPPVLFELAWTLRRAYRMPRDRTLTILTSMLAWEGLTLVDRPLVEAALERARRAGEEFADAYLVATAEAEGAAVATFDQRDFRALGATLHPWSSE